MQSVYEVSFKTFLKNIKIGLNKQKEILRTFNTIKMPTLSNLYI